MANYMNQIAGLLGVELGESFEIVDDNSGKYHNYYRLTDENGIEASNDNADWAAAASVVLKWILMGEIRIIKLLWKPQEDERYYTPCIATHPRYMYDEHYWENDEVDIERYRMGLVCKTAEEAVAMTKKILAAVQGQVVE